MDADLGTLFYACLIICEMADKGVDFAIKDEYQEGNISSDPEESVTDGLQAFIIVGMLISIPRIALYLWKIVLCREGDVSEDETYDAISLWMNLAKALFEAFPQSTIAKFYFGSCAPTNSIKSLVQAFDVFSIFPFIMFVGCLVYHYCVLQGESNRITVILMVVTFLFSLLGFIFACLSFKDFGVLCREKSL